LETLNESRHRVFAVSRFRVFFPWFLHANGHFPRPQTLWATLCAQLEHKLRAGLGFCFCGFFLSSRFCSSKSPNRSISWAAFVHVGAGCQLDTRDSVQLSPFLAVSARFGPCFSPCTLLVFSFHCSAFTKLLGSKSIAKKQR
jgi:hypothetical protein